MLAGGGLFYHFVCHVAYQTDSCYQEPKTGNLLRIITLYILGLSVPPKAIHCYFEYK